MKDRVKNAIDRVRDRSICWAELYYHAKLLADRINELETLLKMKDTDNAQNRRRMDDTGSQPEQRDDG